MVGSGTHLTSVVVCDDVLTNGAGRLALYAVFRDLYADRFPAEVVRLHVVTTWLDQNDFDETVVERVAILGSGEELIGDGAATFTVRAGLYHTQVSRFQDLVFPAPGAYRVVVQRGAEVVADLPLFLVAPEEDTKEVS